jgi:hypothetical protein
MSDMIREAGWPIFPVMIFGFSALAVSLRHALLPQRSLMPLFLSFAAATLVMGALGTALGVQQSARHIGDVPPEQRYIFLIGLKESLNCAAGALLIMLPACLAAGIGSHRMAKRLEAIVSKSA